MSRLSLLVVLLAIGLCPAHSTHAQIYRWDNGQMIPGTEGITPGPGTTLFEWNTDANNLRYADFSGNVNLSGARIFNSWLDNAHFQRANLSYGFLRESNLTAADLTSANLTNLDLWGTLVTHANLTGAVITGANFGGATSRGLTSKQLYATTSYQGRKLNGVNLSNNDLSGWDFRGQNLSNASLNSSVLAGVNLMGADLTSTNLSSSTLAGVNLTGAIVTGANFADTTSLGFTSAQLYATASYQGQDLRGIRLSRNVLSGWDFHGQNLSNANLSSSTFTDANLTNANLIRANLSSSIFTDTNLTNANLTSANLSSSTFTDANLTDANLASANLRSNTLIDAKLRGVNLRGADLTWANLAGADLAAANLDGAILDGAVLIAANLTNTLLTRSSLPNDSWRLYGADMRGAQGRRPVGHNIQPDGSLQRLAVSSLQRFQIRDYDGVPDPAPAAWLTPHAPTPITVQQFVSMASDSTLALLFEPDPWDSVIKFRPGIPVDLGGKLELAFSDEIQLVTESGRTIKVFDWTGVSPQGKFTVQGQPGTAWDTDQLYTTGEVTLMGISSDLNGDKDVDSDDLTAFLANWTGAEYPAADKTWRDGDSDADGDVDSADMLVFLSHWTGAAATASRVAGVPEPSSVLAIGMALAGLMSNLRRRDSRR